MNSLIKRDLRHIWHPCAQMKDFEQAPPFIIQRAKGSILYTDRGEIIDALSSWWCKSLGHGHPEILSAIKNQMKDFEHVIAANSTHPLLVELGEQLYSISGKQHVSFASDGSSAVEIALKLTLHAHQIKGQSQRREFLSLKNAYHGETLGALSVSDLGMYKAPYEGLGAVCHFIDPAPFSVYSRASLWEENISAWEALLPKLEKIKNRLSALIVEPLVQGSGGMRLYSSWFLKKIAAWAKSQGIYLIHDEIMTGVGRTGHWLASELAEVEPDLICLSKGLTAGSLPCSAVLIDHSIFELFYDDYEKGHSFLHSHTHSGNSMAIASALATLKVIKQENILDRAQKLESTMLNHFTEVAKLSQKIVNVRALGGIVAGELVETTDPRIGFKLYQEALSRGALLRPLGNTLYWLPPLNIEEEVIGKLADITLNSVYAAYS